MILSPRPEWHHYAACADQFDSSGNEDPWFPNARDKEAVDAARRICDGCPVRDDCLLDALMAEAAAARSDRYGIRGGLTGPQRRRLFDELRRRSKAVTP